MKIYPVSSMMQPPQDSVQSHSSPVKQYKAMEKKGNKSHIFNSHRSSLNNSLLPIPCQTGTEHDVSPNKIYFFLSLFFFFLVGKERLL